MKTNREVQHPESYLQLVIHAFILQITVSFSFIIYNRYTLSVYSFLKTPCVITYVRQHLRDNSQERLALLEARLTEEQDWRKQLEADLSAAQAALRKDKEVHLSSTLSRTKKQKNEFSKITKMAEIKIFKMKK